MGLFICCLLLVVGTVALVMGISFYMRNIKYEKETSIIILMYGLASGVWCYIYGLIGILPVVQYAGYIRMVGIVAVNAFIMTEVFLACKLIAFKRSRDMIIKHVMLLFAIVDTIMYAQKDVDIFYRDNGWTTWQANPAYSFARNFHSAYVGLTFVVLFALASVWISRETLKREWRFVNLLYIANFMFAACSIPDTFFPLLGKPAYATSGIGAALCTMVVWYGATQLNYFDIRMGNIADKFLDFIDAGILILDTDRNVSIMNNYCKNLFDEAGFQVESLPELFSANGYDYDEVFTVALDNIWNNRLSNMDQTHFYSIRINALKDDFGAPFCYLCVFIDVTEEMEMVDKLEVASQAKTDFLAQMSHEIRTPINTVLGMNEMILRRTTDEEIREYANNIDSSGRILLSLINSILDFSKIEDGRMDIVPVEYDTGALISHIEDSVSQTAAEKNLSFELYVDERLPKKLFGDDVRISQIIMNLLTNAVKYTPKGTVALTVETAEVNEDKVKLYVAVSDTGIGIKKEDLDRLSVSFERLDEVKNHNIEGTGLGISIVTKLLSMMGSELKVDSEYGEGSTFSFMLEQKVIDESPLGDYETYVNEQMEAAERKETIMVSEARILAVDDNNMNLKVISKLLSLFNITPDLATSGKEAIEAAKKNTYDIIFLDHMMPEMDGIETFHKLKEDRLILDDTAVVVLTANAVAGARENYLKEGFSDYLSKPVELDDLERVLKKYLDQSRIIARKEMLETKISNSQKAFPPIEGISWEEAIHHMPNHEMLLDVLQTFCASGETDLNELQTYFETAMEFTDEEHISPYRIKVHAMKNGAATIGAAKVSENAKALEYAARDLNLDFIKEHHNLFEKEYRLLIKRIQKELFHEDSVEKNVMANDALYGNLAMLKAAMEDYDTITLNQMAGLLAQYDFSDEAIRKEINRLQDAIRNFNSEEFYASVEKMEKMLS